MESSPPEPAPPSVPTEEAYAPPFAPHGVARCRHFGWCGGCARQNLPYEEQVALKTSELNALLGDYAAVLKPMETGPSPWFYRNKMEFAFGFERGELAIGLRRKGKFFGVVRLEECFLMHEAVGAVLAAVRDWTTAHTWPPYHLRRHQGLLRYVVMRDGKRSGELLVMLVTAPPAEPTVPGGPAAFEATLDELARRLAPLGVTSLLWCVTDRQADLAVGEIRKTVLGHPWLEEHQSGFTYKLSPYAFFQPNVVLAERLGERAGEMLGGPWPVLVDLYCGVGGLTLPLSKRVGRAIGVEVEGAAVEDAGRNAALNGVTTVQFVAEDSLTFLRRFSNYSFLADRWAVTLDPPRAGMHPKMAAQLLRVAPPVILYVSCNPKKLVEDLGILTRDYRLEEAVPFDFFPHTPHVEVLAKLVRR
ncbi:MAG: 23S rRNA (uracil(1939)-C(5))-methyltransferase RlmD [Candidatus Coatesbacteria bacterium]